MTRLRLPIGGRGTEAEEETATDADERSSGSGVGRKLLAAVGVAGAAYLAVRRLRSSGDGSQRGEASGDESASDAAEASSQATASDRDGEPIEDAPGEDRSPEEIAERVGDDVEAKPAEPGEMAIDESVVDAVDEAELSTADEEDAGAEGDAGGDEEETS